MSGIGTIRAYGEEERFCAENTKRMDVENRAYWMTVANQRWLALWLDWMGVVLTTVVVFLIVSVGRCHRSHATRADTAIRRERHIIDVAQEDLADSWAPSSGGRRTGERVKLPLRL